MRIIDRISWTALAVAILTGCGSSLSDEETAVDGVSSHVRIITRTTGNAAINYPLMLYAFRAESGKLAAAAEVDAADEGLSLDLVSGNYKLIAVAGTDGLYLPQTPALTASLGIPEDGILTEALQRGAADIIVAGMNQSANIALAYQVAQVDLELHDIPAEVTAVNVAFSTLYADETINGDYSGNQVVTVPLAAAGAGVWKAKTVYLLPSNGSQLTLSIALTDSEGTTSYGYTHSGNLKAATPYHLVGSYLEGFEVSGNISAEGWAATESINFTFGLENGVTEEGDADEEGNVGNETDADGNYLVSSIPSERSVWNNHFVAARSNVSETGAELLLMSLKEWMLLPSAASAAAEMYSENGVTDWRIPTETELKTFSPKVCIAGAMDNVNASFISAGGDMLTSQGNYLCSDAGRYISMGVNSPISFTVTSTAEYRLRLVKSITVIKQED